jgi:hypothetical protein
MPYNNFYINVLLLDEPTIYMGMKYMLVYDRLRDGCIAKSM